MSVKEQVEKKLEAKWKKENDILLRRNDVALCNVKVTAPGTGSVCFGDKDAVEPAEVDTDVTFQQTPDADGQLTATATEKPLASTSTATPSFREFIVTPKKTRSSSTIKRRVGHATIITTSPYKQSLIASKKTKLSDGQDKGKRRKNEQATV